MSSVLNRAHSFVSLSDNKNMHLQKSNLWGAYQYDELHHTWTIFSINFGAYPASRYFVSPTLTSSHGAQNATRRKAFELFFDTYKARLNPV